jgi:nucleotide-binding universal stress UspA family protein
MDGCARRGDSGCTEARKPAAGVFAVPRAGEATVEILLAYDHSRNARIALGVIRRLFDALRPTITLISVIEEPGSATGAGDEMFSAQYQEQKAGTEAAAAELAADGYEARVLIAQGDARKMILRAIEERKPDMLVIARHSHKPDGNFLARRLDALVEEFDYMTFGSVSAYMARRAQVPLLIIPTHVED